MAIRDIIKINEEKCDGCGKCVPGCAEGAIKIINGKAKLIADNLCDGIGNCIGHCPQDAIEINKRDAEEFDETAVEKHLEKISVKNVIGNTIHKGCPGSKSMSINNGISKSSVDVIESDIELKIKPQLKQWPVQLKLVPETAPYFENSELLITADCVPFAYPNYHLDLLKNKSVVIGCPKLDDVGFYINKLVNIIKLNNIKDVTVAYMEVPCCQGIVKAVEEAVKIVNKDVNVKKVKIKITGEREK